MLKRKKTDQERFWNKVEKGSPESCWLWTASTSGGRGANKYGAFSTGGRKFKKNWYAHRYSYFIHKGEIPDGLEVMHSCDNGLCVNPAHLEVGTRKKNMEDASKRGRLNPYDRRGENNSNAKLSDAQVEEILDLISKGYTQQSISELYSVRQSSISYIKRGKRQRVS